MKLLSERCKYSATKAVGFYILRFSSAYCKGYDKSNPTGTGIEKAVKRTESV